MPCFAAALFLAARSGRLRPVFPCVAMTYTFTAMDDLAFFAVIAVQTRA